jgi:membrane protein required for beta-lactamase induction
MTQSYPWSSLKSAVQNIPDNNLRQMVGEIETYRQGKLAKDTHMMRHFEREYLLHGLLEDHNSLRALEDAVIWEAAWRFYLR